MDLSYGSKKMMKQCASEKAMRAEWGTDMAKKLKLRLHALATAVNLEELGRLPQGRCHELSGDREGQLSLDLVHPYRLVFMPDHDPVPTKEDGGLDWSAVTRIVVLEVYNPHE